MGLKDLSKKELRREVKHLLSEIDRLNELLNPEFTFKELNAKWNEEHGTVDARMIGAEPGQHPAMKVLAAAAIAQLESIPGAENYVATQWFYTPAGSADEICLEVASARSRNQTPSALRHKAEDELKALKARCGEAPAPKAPKMTGAGFSGDGPISNEVGDTGTGGPGDSRR